MRSLFVRITASISLLTLLSPAAVLAVGFEDATKNPTVNNYFNFANLGADGKPSTDEYKIPAIAKKDPRAIITNIIGIVSGFLGIIAVVIILISGFQWMTAGGEEEAVKTAQKRLVQGVIGLVLILSTWSVAYYIVNTLSGSIFQ